MRINLNQRYNTFTYLDAHAKKYKLVSHINHENIPEKKKVNKISKLFTYFSACKN